MGKMTKKRKLDSRKSLATVKQKNILKYKQGKKGLLKENSSSVRRTQRRVEERRVHYAQLANKFKDQKVKKQIEEENLLTVEDMMEMIDPEDMDALIKDGERTQKKKIEKREEVQKIESKYGHIAAPAQDVDDDKMEVDDAENKKKPKTRLKMLLPIATDSGWEEKTVEIPDDIKDLENDSKYKKKSKVSGEKDMDDLSSDEEDEIPEVDIKSVSEILAQRARRIHKKKVRLACIATNIIQDSAKIGNLEALLMMYTEIDVLTEPTLMQHCLLTIFQVFNSIIPGYRIQEKSLDQKVKKDTYLVAKTELATLKCYRQFLKALEEILEKYRKDPKNIALEAVGKTAVSCYGELLWRYPKFNYSLNIAQTLIPVLNFPSEEFRKLALEPINRTIRMDKKCGIAVDIVKKIYKLIQRKKYKVKKEVLQVFLSLRVNDMQNSDILYANEKRSNKDMTHSEKMLKKLQEKSRLKKSRKQKKEVKKMAKLREKMSDIKIKELMVEKNENHTEILRVVFGVYVHIMKKKPKSNLMPCVLEGLALFAHLINMEFFSDLLSLINSFLDGGQLGTTESLYCIQTVFTILSGQGQYLTIDPTRFYKHFYAMLFNIKTIELHRNMPLVLRILHQMLVARKKKITSSKVMSFAKRMSTLCLSLQHDAAIPTLVCLKDLFSSFSCTESLLDPDPEGCPGIFQPNIGDPEHSNAGATAVWELHHLSRHYQPYVRSLSANIISGVPLREVLQLNFFVRRNVKDLFDDFSVAKLKLKPALPSPAVHLKVKKRNRNVDIAYDYENKKWITTEKKQ